MAKMILKRIPSEEDLNECGGVEPHSFLNAFSENSIEGELAATVTINEYGAAVLGEWLIDPADWYKIEE